MPETTPSPAVPLASSPGEPSGAREAVWLTTEEAEAKLDRHEGYVLCPEFFRRGKVQTAVAVVVALPLIAAVAKVASSYRFGDEGLVMLAVAVLSLGLIPLAAFWERRQAARRAPDGALKEGFGTGAGQLVHLIVRQGDAPTGEDRGMLWVEDGRLYFSGHRTSFGLVSSQVARIGPRVDAVQGVRNEISLTLRRGTPVGPLEVSFGLGEAPEPAAWNRLNELRHALETWQSRSFEREGQWPPTALGPGAVSERCLFLQAALTTFAFPLLVFGLGARTSLPGAAIGAFTVLVLLSRGGLCRLRWRALRDRRRLRGSAR